MCVCVFQDLIIHNSAEPSALHACMTRVCIAWLTVSVCLFKVLSYVHTVHLNMVLIYRIWCYSLQSQCRSISRGRHLAMSL